MTFRTFPRNDGTVKAPGTWRRVAEAARAVWVALVCCPQCGVECSLRGTHAVEADGTVRPSLVCPTEGCSFHEHVRLDGWP